VTGLNLNLIILINVNYAIKIGLAGTGHIKGLVDYKNHYAKKP
jgi:hypothetical protein